MSEADDTRICSWCRGPLGADEEICEDCRLKAIKEEERQTEADHEFVEKELLRLEELEERLKVLKVDLKDGLPVCPQCFIEYQAHVKSCSECGIDLISCDQALETLSAEMDKLREELRRGGKRNWIGVYESQDVYAVIATVRALEKENIPSMVRSAGFNGSVFQALYPGSPNLQRYRQTIMVPLPAEAQAREVLEKIDLAGGPAKPVSVDVLQDYLVKLSPDLNRKKVHCPSCLKDFDRPTERCPQCGYEPLLLAEELGVLLEGMRKSNDKGEAI